MLTNNPNPENTKNIEEKSEENEKAEKLAELQKEEDEKLWNEFEDVPIRRYSLCAKLTLQIL